MRRVAASVPQALARATGKEVGGLRPPSPPFECICVYTEEFRTDLNSRAIMGASTGSGLTP
jgi:hypothetical protein